MFHVKHEGWTEDPGPRLARFEELLRAYAIPRGLIGGQDEPVLRPRHIEDSLRALDAIPVEARRAVDLGSGAGLPGIPVAIARPELEVVLAEVRRTRVAFLELAVQELACGNVQVFPHSVESLSPGFDVAFARGFGDASRSWRAADRVLGPGGRLVYWAGRSFARDDEPHGVRVIRVLDPPLESGGPVAIMARQ